MKIRHFLTVAALSLTAGLAPAFVAAETIKVGSTPTGVPFTFLDVEKNEITGMMVDVVDAIGKHAGFEADVQSTDWASLIPALNSGRIDMIAAAMSITDERKEVVNFSDPVFPYAEGLVVRADDATVYSQSLTETAGKVIGVQQGTSFHKALEAMEGIGEIKVYENIADIMRDVELGRIVAGVADQPIMAYQIGQGKFPDLKMAEGYEPQISLPLGLAISKDNPELLERVNKGLATIRENGELDALAIKWNLN
ncbi:ABC transporter substrate-binding protein [Paracoccus sp. IB05]|uniref:ABC transporter substrate-binding protein n=1 Tax=Paracoccus sp. IB05 TaxID=2779367 RepID=UPI0018E7AE27|nr:ABC transporter substrate-binding protein [Paracoccus sp. IB05]MBJ2152844.1 amino acid ABC transporter substrate-binding protein [Paracoccus sp. IB05]